VAPESTGQQDLGTYARIFWRWKWLFLAFLVLIPLGTYVYEQSKPSVYKSGTLIELQNISTQSGISPVASGSLDAIARLVTTTPVVNTAARLLNQPPGSLSSEVSATADPNTGFLTISAQDHDPARAAAIANAFAAALANRQAAQATYQINQQVSALQKQLAATPRSDPGQRVTLTQQIGQLKALTASAVSSSQVVQAAAPSGTPVSPKTRRAVELALVIALLLGIGAVLLAENADRRLRSPEDIESLTSWPLLAAIPPSAFSPDHLTDPGDEEAFQMLRVALTYFNVERPIRSVEIISPLVGDGKTTVAVGLALATARAGKRAILVDADLRRPGVCERLGIPDSDGLGAVLAGEKAVTDVMREYRVETPEAGQLLVLGAGPPPPNPAALIDSERMRALLHDLENQADLVIVDSVAALSVSDSLALLKTVSGSVAVARMNRSSRVAVRRLQKMIASAGGTVLGVVATGTAAGGGYGAYYPYGEDGQHGVFGLLHLRNRRSPVSAEAASSNGAVAAADQTNADAAGSTAAEQTED
jgi:capsular exopolysaccharide synthesis family protein